MDISIDLIRFFPIKKHFILKSEVTKIVTATF